MADTNTSRRLDSLDFLDNDPFAELTRIMGHDPRAAGQDEGPVVVHTAPAAVAEPDRDDLDIEFDLEKELMGDFDFAGLDEPARPAAVDQASLAHEPADWGPEESAGEPPAQEVAWDADLSFELDPADFDMPPEPASREPEFAAHGHAAPEIAPQPAGEADFDFSFDLSEEFAADAQAAAEASRDEVGETDEPENADTYVESAFPREALVGDVPAEEPAFEELEQQEPVAAFEGEPLFLEEADAQDTHDEPAAYTQPVHAEPAYEAPAYTEPSYPQATHDEPSYQEPALDVPDYGAEAGFAPEQAAGALSLEDELNALLAGSTAPAATEPRFEPEPVQQPLAEQDWQPSVDTFGHADPAVWEDDAGSEAAAAEPAAHADHGWTAPQQPAAAQDDDLADMFGAMELDLDFEPEATVQVWDPVSGPAEVATPSPAGRSRLTPEVETLEISEAALAVEDDLDIPDIDYGAAQPAPRRYDQLESQFEEAFGDFALDEHEPTEPQPVAAVVAAPSHASAAQEDWQPRHEPADDDFDYRHDLEQAVSASTYDDEEADLEPEPRRRGLLIAAFVAAVAVVGGAGVFGMSFFGGDSDGPVLVRADTDPMKVRPEEPGGTTVPNQNNEVYQRVAGGESDAPPQQESLISTAEEPLDVTAAEELPVLAPGISEEGEEAEMAAAQQPKSEERIAPETEEAALGALEEAPVVTPRRVRTMVVRPDGTMVPREELEPAADAQPAAPTVADAERLPVAGPEEVALAPALAESPETAAQSAPEEVIAEDEGGPIVETPQIVTVVPTPRVEPSAAAPAATPAVAQPAATPAATPASAPAAAASAGADGSWSMQIASQPTAEGAQSSYQDLARRYGSVLQGRGVNIVRADIEGMGTYYRVRIPAATRDEAIQLCTRYKSAGGSCFVSR